VVHEETCDYGRDRERERGRREKKEVISGKVCGGHDGP